MKLPSYLRIKKTDYPSETQGIMEKLSFSINSAFDSLFSLANRNISLRDNIKGVLKEFDIEVDSSSVPKETLKLALDIPGQVEGVSILKAESQTNTPVYPTAGLFLSYTQDGQSIKVDKLIGLPANTKFKVKVHVIL